MCIKIYATLYTSRQCSAMFATGGAPLYVAGAAVSLLDRCLSRLPNLGSLETNQPASSQARLSRIVAVALLSCGAGVTTMSVLIS